MNEEYTELYNSVRAFVNEVVEAFKDIFTKVIAILTDLFSVKKPAVIASGKCL